MNNYDANSILEFDFEHNDLINEDELNYDSLAEGIMAAAHELLPLLEYDDESDSSFEDVNSSVNDDAIAEAFSQAIASERKQSSNISKKRVKNSSSYSTLTEEQRAEVFEQRKACAKSNSLINSRKRNAFPEPINKMLLSDTNDEVMLFIEQLTYIAVSQSMSLGNLKQFKADTSEYNALRFNETMILAALFGVPTVLHKIATRAGKAPQELQFPECVIDCRKVLHDKYQRRTFSPDQKSPSNDWFHFAVELKNSLNSSKSAFEFLHFIFKYTEDRSGGIVFDYANLALLFQNNLDLDFESDVLSELGRLNQEKPSVFKKQRKIQQFKKLCEQKIKGQTHAISAVTEMVASAFNAKKTGPRGIVTFMGASGTGKTALAETLVDALNEVYGASYRKLLLNMEMYSDDRSSMKLFGTGSQYVDSALGELTTEVLIAPRTVIIIDEIEKAHRTVIQSLLTLLEKGEMTDQTTNKVVDFSQCIFVFTTNLGQKAAKQSLSKNKPLDLSALLAEKPGKVGLSSELISRLSRGSVALFRELEIKDLLNMAEHAANIAREDKTLCWPEDLPEMLVETLGGDLAPRTILAQASKLQGKIVEFVLSTIEETANDPRIEVEIAEDIANFHYAVVTQDRLLTRLLKKYFPNCKVLTDVSQIQQLSSEQNIQAVLIDQPQCSTELAAEHKGNLHFYSFGYQHQGVDEAIKPTQIERHFKLVDFTVPSLTAFIKQVAKRCRLLTSAEQLRKRKMMVEFDYQLTRIDDGFKVTLQHPVYEQRFDPNDFEAPYMQEPCIPKISFQDIIGQDELKQSMTFILQRLRGANDFVLDMPKGYLFAGLPGTGKSYFAKAIAGECQVPFIPVNAADLMNGDVVININHLFEVAARYAPCIVFLDEIDAIALSREQNSIHGRLAVNTLLTQLDGFNNSDNPVFVLAATNFAHKLDPAVMRHGRFDKMVTIPLPDLAARTRFIEQCCNKYKFQLTDAALLSFAKRVSGASYGFLETLFRDLQLTLLTKQCQFSASMLDEQLLAATIGNKKAVSSYNDKDRLAIAYHETGHYLMYKHLHPKARCTNLSIQEHERSGGITMFDLDGQVLSNTKANYKAQLQVLLAGRAAEKLLSEHDDDISAGASHDIQQATLLAKRAISDLGFSDSLGLADFKQLPMLQTKVENEVVEWLNTAFIASETYLRKNWALVKQIAEVLFEQETLDQDQLDNIATLPNKKNAKA
ncbi:AAA family ATPase [Rheinheimera sp. UJ63]|uniref:AAA family ATPase n=1 Tax=Rheinheimera sp. UJ63 TaxID=2910157 RepID=UPI001F1FCA36|nr:AAA family ATPase [Rheinheimera sp. UJ63]MCF4010604.1 AAA family ATPase [Rheinheimera sp. UJ63]